MYRKVELVLVNAHTSNWRRTVGDRCSLHSCAVDIFNYKSMLNTAYCKTSHRIRRRACVWEATSEGASGVTSQEIYDVLQLSRHGGATQVINK